MSTQNLGAILKDIIDDGYLEDRSEYDVEDLQLAYSLSQEQARDLHALIQQEMAKPAPPCERAYPQGEGHRHPRFPSGDCVICGALCTEGCKWDGVEPETKQTKKQSMKTCIPFFRHSLGWRWEGNGSELIIELWRLRITAHIQPNW
jgi:hypothetical protein